MSLPLAYRPGLRCAAPSTGAGPGALLCAVDEGAAPHHAPAQGPASYQGTPALPGAAQ